MIFTPVPAAALATSAGSRPRPGTVMSSIAPTPAERSAVSRSRAAATSARSSQPPNPGQPQCSGSVLMNTCSCMSTTPRSSALVSPEVVGTPGIAFLLPAAGGGQVPQGPVPTVNGYAARWSRAIRGEEGPRDDPVSGLVGMLVGPARRPGALPRPPADRCHVGRQAAEPGQAHPAVEIRGPERTGHIGDADAGRLVNAGQHGVVGGSGQLAQPCDAVADEAGAPLRESRQVVAHADNLDPRGSGANPVQDVAEVRRRSPDAVADAAC